MPEGLLEMLFTDLFECLSRGLDVVEKHDPGLAHEIADAFAAFHEALKAEMRRWHVMKENDAFIRSIMPELFKDEEH
jgi:hypothetical protein